MLLPVPLTVGPAFQPGPSGDLEVKLSASWLVCRQECIPQDGNFVLHIPVRGSVALHGADFDAAQRAVPTPLAGSAQANVAGKLVTLRVNGLPAAWQGKALQAFPEIGTLFDTSGTPGSATLASPLGAAGRRTGLAAATPGRAALRYPTSAAPIHPCCPWCCAGGTRLFS